MTDETMLVFDPGQATGWSRWVLPQSAPIMRLEYGLIPGGVQGFFRWLEAGGLNDRPTIIVCERFNPDLGERVKDYEPIRVEVALEGACRALALEITWQDIDMKPMCRDSTLKRLGLWVENSEVDWEDARDVNDTQRHALAWCKTHDHEPTVHWAWPPMTD